MGVGTQRLDFAEFYRVAKDECLFTVLVSVGDQDVAKGQASKTAKAGDLTCNWRPPVRYKQGAGLRPRPY